MSSSQVFAVKEFNEIIGHIRVGHLRGMGREAMVPLVDSQDMEFIREPLADRLPIVERPEKSVEDNQRFAGAVAFEIQLHARV